MKQRGSALIYILIAIALLGALTMAFVEPSGQQSRSQNSFKIATQLRDQAEVFRAAVQDCILTYPAGDTSNATKYAGYTEPYPVTPSSTYLPSGSQDSFSKAGSMRCPGNPGDSNNHTLIFGGTTGKFVPPPPTLFGAWQYVNSSDGVYLLAPTDKTDAYLWDGIQKAAAMYGQCEASTLDGVTPCSTNTKCLQVWIIRKTACP